MLAALPLVAMWVGAASAAPVLAGASAAGMVRIGSEPNGGKLGAMGAGVAIEAGLPVAPRVLVEAQSEGGAAGGDPFGDLRLGVRWYLTEPWRSSPSIALVGGAGVGWRSGPASTATLGASLELRRRHRLLPRLQARYVGETVSGLDAPGTSSVLLTIGAAWLPAALGAPRINPPEAMVWLPHPICDWIPAASAGPILASLDAHEHFEVVSENHAPQYLEGPPTLELRLSEVPSQGSLVIVGRPGDRVEIGEDPVGLSRGGTAIVTSREGEVSIQIVGGGRSHQMVAGVVDGYATWVRAPEPQPQLIRFPAGSAELTAEGRDAVDQIARLAGDWSFALAGSHSPEGEETTNDQLARDRSIAVRDALVLAGLPTQRLTLAPPYAPDEAAPLTDQRACRVLPLIPQEAP